MPKFIRHEPELLLISFCDIVTITTAALFMSMIVVIDMAQRIPTVKPTPVVRQTSKTPVYYECRSNQLFYVNREVLIQRVNTEWDRFGADVSQTNRLESSLQFVSQMNVGDDYYTVDQYRLLMGLLALKPRPGARGVTENDLVVSRTNPFRLALDNMMTTQDRYVVFLVRDDSFRVFRKAREMVNKAGLTSGWEYLDHDEPISFSGVFARVGVQ